jgi:hypothetical protein
MFDLPEISVRRGGVRYPDPAAPLLVAVGGWCVPGPSLFENLSPTVLDLVGEPCDGNHQWRRMIYSGGGCQCPMCEPPLDSPTRLLECDGCDAEVREDADGFEDLWEAAPW